MQSTNFLDVYFSFYKEVSDSILFNDKDINIDLTNMMTKKCVLMVYKALTNSCNALKMILIDLHKDNILEKFNNLF